MPRFGQRGFGPRRSWGSQPGVAFMKHCALPPIGSHQGEPCDSTFDSPLGVGHARYLPSARNLPNLSRRHPTCGLVRQECPPVVACVRPSSGIPAVLLVGS